jgi:hypothetical protein
MQSISLGHYHNLPEIRLIMKRVIVILLLLLPLSMLSQSSNGSVEFWTKLKQLCGKAYEGTISESPTASGTFQGKKLVMHVRSCGEKQIRIPFIVGDDRSRTWVLTMTENRITLKHDHRHEDGSEDKNTQYGGVSMNEGTSSMQVFPADQYTAELIPAAHANVWWITLDDKSFTYNLRRIGTDRLVTVTFDLTKEIPAPEAPWGWKD